MTAPRNPDRLITAFIDEGQTEAPDRILDAIRSDIHRTRQRVVIGPWREPRMSRPVGLSIAAVFVVAIGLALFNFASITGPSGVAPTPTPSPSPTPSPTPSLTPSPTPGVGLIRNGPLEGGRYAFTYELIALADGLRGPTITITVPPGGWTAFENFAVDKNYGPTNSIDSAGPSFVVWRIENRYIDPCRTLQIQTSGLAGSPPPVLEPSPGPGIDELLETLADQPGLAAGPLTDVTIDGYAGKFVELTVVTDIAQCSGGFYPWVDKWVQGNNELLRVYALDVDGFRLTFFARIPERTLAADRAELESIIESIAIEP